jgi:hypothetical protein
MTGYMTRCEELGWKVGDRFMLKSGAQHAYVKQGEVVILTKDDGTSAPYFKREKDIELDVDAVVSIRCGKLLRAGYLDINGYDVPLPEVEAPVEGTSYYVPDLYEKVLLFTWRGDAFDEWRLRYGLVHLNTKAARRHSKALRSFTKQSKD